MFFLTKELLVSNLDVYPIKITIVGDDIVVIVSGDMGRRIGGVVYYICTYT